ncbi:MAG: hypothetical protein AAFX39_03465 [Pseudomonadota bacterium]
MAALEQSFARHCEAAEEHVAFGIQEIDHILHGGLKCGALHEAISERAAGAPALAGIALGVLQRLKTQQDRSAVWIRQRAIETETGALYPHGIIPLGFDPGDLIVVRAQSVTDALSAGLDAVRCASLSAVVLETWGTPKALDLTATRRLALAAERSGVTPILLRVGADPQPSVAHTRWQVVSAPSRPLPANAPGRPAFDLTLLRNRAGAFGQHWRVEWDHETRQFQSIPPLSRGVVSVPVRRPAQPPATPLAQTG